MSKNKKRKPLPVIPDLPGEVWDNMVGFPNYLISNMGRMKNVRRGNLKKPCDDGAGYHIVSLFYNNKRYVKRLARLVWETFNDCVCGMTIDHINKDKKDDRLSNLRCVTMKENAHNKDKFEKNNKYGLTPSLKGYVAKHLLEGTKSTWVLMKELNIPMKYLRTIRQRGSWNKFIEYEKL